MPEITIKYSSPKTLQILTELARYFNFTIINRTEAKLPKKDPQNIPIDFSSDPDVTALADIWKNNDITLEQLREKAWGDRK